MMALSIALSDDFAALTGAGGALLSMLDSGWDSSTVLTREASERQNSRRAAAVVPTNFVALPRAGCVYSSHAIRRPRIAPAGRDLLSTTGVTMATRTTREVSTTRV